ncbi:GAF and ANTAR domain-containing protein [uncultured Friedmanniella sp.]|uniref:GAF and ANTAR domain-containing protein n=1 Tax=uncultured Friedmanniella sp. TaxID=335381 RepID=UPI0035CB6FA5
MSGRLAADRRWPRLGRALTSDDTASAVAVPLMLGPAFPGGALAVYSRAEDAFDPRDVRVLMTLAYAMADIIARDRLWWCAQWILQQSGYARIVHQAVGILISRNCDEGQALARLQRISSATDRPLAEVAQMIVDEALTEAHLQYIVQTPQQRITHVAVGR